MSDFIRRLEKKYQIAYGRDNLNTATRDALLYGQLYKGLRYEIMLSPAVSGSQGYQELATAAKAEERRLAALKQCQRYSKPHGNDNSTSLPPSTPTGNQSTSRNSGKNAPSGPPLGKDTRKCYNCGETGHIASRCPKTKRESTGTPVKPAGTKQATVVGKLKRSVQLKILLQNLFCHQQPFRLDGRMDLDVAFGSTQMTTPVYIKIDAHDQLLLSEGVCRQLGILQYHPDVETWGGGRKKSTPATNKPKPPSEPATPSSLPAEETPGAEEAKVPTVRVNLVQSVQLLPHQSLVVEVTCSFAGDGENDDSAAYLLGLTELKSGLQVEPSLLSLSAEDGVLAMINNPTGCSMALEGGSLLGEATPVTLVNPAPNGDQTQGIPEEMSAL